MMVIETDRLLLRELGAADAKFILGLLNQPSFLRFIGDKGVRTLADARRYIADGPADSYRRNGFGLNCVTLREAGVQIGICGLVKRDTLPDPDIGFAFLEAYWSMGYAVEAATAVLAHARKTLGIGRVLAIVNPENGRSARLLEKIGLRFERLARLTDGAEELSIYSTVDDAPAAPSPRRRRRSPGVRSRGWR